MKTSIKHDSKASYLDVTQFILKECSPVIKAASPKISFYEQRFERTPQINPIDHDPSKFSMTPIYTGLGGSQILQIMDEFALECNGEVFVSEGKYESRTKHRQKQQKQKSTCLFEIPQDDLILNMIPELQNDDQLQIYYEVYQEVSEQYSQDDYSYSEQFYQSSYKDEDIEKQSTIQASNLQFNEAIERFRENPKKQIIKQMKQVSNSMPEETQLNKKVMIKKHIEKYMLDYQMYCYEEAWKELETYDLPTLIKKVSQGLTETFSKKIGKLPFQVRRTKILKYLEKKQVNIKFRKKRIWKKKVSYDCRKKVADGRLRIKGKFVTREQACEQLGVETLQGYTAEDIKYMLENKMDGRQFDV